MPKSIIIICLALIVSSCGRKAEDAIYLFPQNYQGNILIVFDQSDGSDALYEGKSRVYKIDTSGVLRTKFKANYGLQRNSFFYQDSLGNRKSILYMANLSQRSNGEVVAFNKETGKDFDKEKSADRDYELITVANSANIDSIGNLRSSFMWSKLTPKK